MEETNLPSCEPGRKEKSMAPTTGTAQKKVEENQEPSPNFKSNDHAQISKPLSSYHVVNVPAPEVDEDMPKEEVMNGRIQIVFGLAILAALSSLAGQLRILGLSEALGFVGAMIVIGVAVVVAIPQLRRNFRASP